MMFLGKEIETLVNEEKSAGTYEVTWYAEIYQAEFISINLKLAALSKQRKWC